MINMGKKELFIKRVYEIVAELKIPLIDERVYDKVNVKDSVYGTNVTFVFDQDEGVIRGFLGLAEYFRTVVIKKKNDFIIPSPSALFILENK